MPRDRFAHIGLDRVVRRAWVERVASLALAGNDAQSAKPILHEEIKGFFQPKSTHKRGSLDKTITILLRVWLRTPTDLELLRMEGLRLLNQVSQRDHVAIHWGMLMAVYPFWSGVATQVGRLLRLQGSAVASHVQRRVREQYGERETVSRSTQRALRSFVDWGVLRETGSRGVYSAGAALSLSNPRLIAWLAEASLHARSNGSLTLRSLVDSPSLFPFRFGDINAGSLAANSPRLDVLRHGLDDDLVMLKPA